MLDFTSCADHLGKPTAADLKLGLATGPVLFACRQVSQQEAVSRSKKCKLLSTGPAETHQISSVSHEGGWGIVTNQCVQYQMDFVHTQVLRNTFLHNSLLGSCRYAESLSTFCEGYS